MRIESVINLFDEETKAKILASVPGAVSELPIVEETSQIPVVRKAEVPPYNELRVPLHRLYSPRSGEHYYTTKAAELDKAVRVYGYNYENLAAHILSSQVDDTVPLYRIRQGKRHLYTTNLAESIRASTDGSAPGIVGYVHPTEQYGTLPFFRLFNAKSGDRLFTTSIDEKYSLQKVGWQDEGIACYVYL